MLRVLYSSLWFIFQPLLLLRLWYKARQNPQYLERWQERFGNVPMNFPKGVLWIHAGSVGETIAAVPFVKSIKETFPHIPILFTSMTPTGSEQVKRSFGDSVYHCYLPYDISYGIERFLRRVQPKCLILMESEIWPNLLYHVGLRKLPIMIANARLSPVSQARYAKLRYFVESLFRPVAIVGAQSEPDVTAYSKIGVPAQKIHLLGNLKFDMVPPPLLIEKGEQLKQQIGSRPVWIAASTHPGEEEVALAAHAKLRKQVPNALLILVPRHPDRFSAVEKLLQEKSISYVKRSSGEVPTENTYVYLGDTMGELFTYYQASWVAFVGGSMFPNIGGHNTLEPASLGLPVLSGMYNENFKAITQWMTEAKGLLLIDSADKLAERVGELLANREAAHTMGQAALSVVKRNQGAVARHIDSLKMLLDA